MHDWNALALFGVVGLGMATSAALLVHTVIAGFRGRAESANRESACSCC